MTMTDYNDGKWHGWNGGECPVDPQAEIEAFYIPGGAEDDKPYRFKNVAGAKVWDRPCLFRVTKPAPPKPREWWLYRANEAEEWCVSKSKPHESWLSVHVREVLPE